jgi:hypothetical protein
MDISKKIEEIRRKPERIRLRYIWGLVAISMVFIVIIWLLSIRESAKNLHFSNDSNLPDISKSLEEIGSIKDSSPSINDIMENVDNSININEESLQDQSNPQLPANNN